MVGEADPAAARAATNATTTQWRANFLAELKIGDPLGTVSRMRRDGTLAAIQRAIMIRHGVLTQIHAKRHGTLNVKAFMRACLLERNRDPAGAPEP